MNHPSVCPTHTMSPAQLELWEKLQTFSLDRPGAQFSFSDRLAREHQWSRDYTRRVVDEYKKFLFLAVITEQAVSPSEAVDQVWHCHLTYTRSYWIDLCDQVLKKPLHHHPTQGGAQQKAFFFQVYRNTLVSYKTVFGQLPPADIWPSPEVRFSQFSPVKRIDTQAYWVLPKPTWVRRRSLQRLRVGRSRLVVLSLLLALLLVWGAATPLGAIDTALWSAPLPQPAGMIAPPPDILYDGPGGESGPIAMLFRHVIWSILAGFSLLFVSAGLCLAVGLVFSYWFDQNSRRRSPGSAVSSGSRGSQVPVTPRDNSHYDTDSYSCQTTSYYDTDSYSCQTNSTDVCGACI